MRKTDLPTKVCAACGRPFSARRKWISRGQWPAVKYCSTRCRNRGEP